MCSLMSCLEKIHLKRFKVKSDVWLYYILLKHSNTIRRHPLAFSLCRQQNYFLSCCIFSAAWGDTMKRGDWQRPSLFKPLHNLVCSWLWSVPHGFSWLWCLASFEAAWIPFHMWLHYNQSFSRKIILHTIQPWLLNFSAFDPWNKIWDLWPKLFTLLLSYLIKIQNAEKDCRNLLNWII